MDPEAPSGIDDPCMSMCRPWRPTAPAAPGTLPDTPRLCRGCLEGLRGRSVTYSFLARALGPCLTSSTKQRQATRPRPTLSCGCGDGAPYTRAERFCWSFCSSPPRPAFRLQISVSLGDPCVEQGAELLSTTVVRPLPCRACPGTAWTQTGCSTSPLRFDELRALGKRGWRVE